MEQKRLTLLIFVLFAFVLGILIFLSASSPVHRWGDASTYYMQMASIVEDHDIQYQAIDLQRAVNAHFDDLPAGVLLIKTVQGTYFFGKEFTYALFAAPSFAVGGIQGTLILNALMFWAMILMGFFYLKKKGNSDIAAFCTSSIFFTVSTAFVYVFWLHSEIYNMFLLTLGLFLVTKSYDKPGNDSYLLCSAFIFGLATVSRIPNGLLFLPFLVYELYSRNFKKVLFLFTLFLIPILLCYGYFYAVSGVALFYGGDQSCYIGNYPFMNASGGTTGQDISSLSYTNQYHITMGDNPAQIAADRIIGIDYTNGLYNAIYFFFGRFTGLLWYYPLAAFALISFLTVAFSSRIKRQKNRNKISEPTGDYTQYLILLGIILNILFFLFINGTNYFGGQHAVGNRYFWVYPAFLYLIGKVNFKLIIPFILLALFTVFPIITDPVSNSQYPQDHTLSLPYSSFPLEKNQIRNLPLWFPQPILQNLSFIYIDSEGAPAPVYMGSNSYSLSGTSHWIVQKYRSPDHITLIFTSHGNENSYVSVHSDDYSRLISVNKTYPMKISIPLGLSPNYSNPFFNDLSVSTTSEIQMTVIGRETEDQMLHYSFGWYDEEKNIKGSWRWMTNHSTLLVYSDDDQSKWLQFEATSFIRPISFNIQADGECSTHTLNPGAYATITVPMHLHPGITVVEWDVPDGCSRPSDIPGLDNPDSRCLSFNVRNLTLLSQLPSSNTSNKQELQYSYGWYDEERDNNGSWRWMTNHSTLLVGSDDDQNKWLQFEATSFIRPIALTIQADGASSTHTLNPGAYTTLTVPMHLHPGSTVVEWDVPDGCSRPSDIPVLDNPDSRCLSLNVRNITLLSQLPSNNTSKKQELQYSDQWLDEEKNTKGSWRWMVDNLDYYNLSYYSKRVMVSV